MFARGNSIVPLFHRILLGMCSSKTISSSVFVLVLPWIDNQRRIIHSTRITNIEWLIYWLFYLYIIIIQTHWMNNSIYKMHVVLFDLFLCCNSAIYIMYSIDIIEVEWEISCPIFWSDKRNNKLVLLLSTSSNRIKYPTSSKSRMIWNRMVIRFWGGMMHIVQLSTSMCKAYTYMCIQCYCLFY